MISFFVSLLILGMCRVSRRDGVRPFWVGCVGVACGVSFAEQDSRRTNEDVVRWWFDFG